MLVDRWNPTPTARSGQFVAFGLPAPRGCCTRRPIGLAEGEGFEPPEPLRVQWFSRPPPSTTRPSLPPSQASDASELRRARRRTFILFVNPVLSGSAQ